MALAEGTEVRSFYIIDTKVRVVPMPIPIVTKAISLAKRKAASASFLRVGKTGTPCFA